MLCRLHTMYKIIHCVALHTLCDITQSVSNHTVKWSIFCGTSSKIYTCPKKITRALPLAPVTNIRYGPSPILKLIHLSRYPCFPFSSEIELSPVTLTHPTPLTHIESVNVPLFAPLCQRCFTTWRQKIYFLLVGEISPKCDIFFISVTHNLYIFVQC